MQGWSCHRQHQVQRQQGNLYRRVPNPRSHRCDKEVTYKIVDKDDGSQTIEFTVEEGKDPVSMPFSQDKDKKTITLAKLFVFNKK